MGGGVAKGANDGAGGGRDGGLKFGVVFIVTLMLLLMLLLLLLCIQLQHAAGLCLEHEPHTVLTVHANGVTNKGSDKYVRARTRILRRRSGAQLR